MLANELWKQVASTSDQTSRKHQPLRRVPLSLWKRSEGVPGKMRLYIFHCLDKKLGTDSVCDRMSESIVNRGLFKLKKKAIKRRQSGQATPMGCLLGGVEATVDTSKMNLVPASKGNRAHTLPAAVQMLKRLSPLSGAH